MNISSVSSAKAMVEEATETASQTKAKAAKGDQRAIRKLARQQVPERTQNSQQTAAETPVYKGLLNIQA